MKQIIIILAMLLLCGTATANVPDADHYMIVVLVWNNETGEREAGLPVTFMYHPYFADEMFTLETAEDGSVVFDIANMPRGVRHNSVIMVSCKYGIKNAPVIYYTNESIWNEPNQSYDVHRVGNWGTAVTFNEPDEATVIEILAAMGFTAIAIGGGRYLLRRKKQLDIQGDIMTKTWYTSKTLWMNAIGIVAIITQAQFGFIIDPATQVAILGTLNVVLRAITGESITWSNPDE